VIKQIRYLVNYKVYETDNTALGKTKRVHVTAVLVMMTL